MIEKPLVWDTLISPAPSVITIVIFHVVQLEIGQTDKFNVLSYFAGECRIFLYKKKTYQQENDENNSDFLIFAPIMLFQLRRFDFERVRLIIKDFGFIYELLDLFSTFYYFVY